MSSRHGGCAMQLHMFDYEKQENPELTDDTTVFAAGFNDTSNTFVTAAGRDVKVRTHVNTGRKPCLVLTTCDLVGGWWSCPCSGVECHLWRLVAEVSSLAGRRLDRVLLGRPQAQVCDWRPPRWCSCLRLPQRLPPEDAVPARRRGEYGGGPATLLWWLCRITHTHTGWFGSQVTKLKYCARDKTVISASRDLTIVVSDESLADKGALLKEIKGGHTSEIGAMDFSCHLSLIASGCHDGLLCVWDYEFGKLSNLCLGHTSGASSRYPLLLLLLLLCVSCSHNPAHLPMRRACVPAITCVAFIEPLSLVAAADANGTVAIWAVRPSPRAGECVARFVNKVGDQMSNAGDDVEDGTAVPALQGSCAVMAMAADVTWVPAVPDAGTGAGNSGEGDDASASGSAGAGAGAGASAGAGAGAGAGADEHRTPRRQSVSHGGDDSTATSPSAKGVPVVVLYIADDRVRRPATVGRCAVLVWKLTSYVCQGIIKKWSLTQLVRSMLQSGDVVHQVSPYPALFPRRNLRTFTCRILAHVGVVSAGC